MTKLRQKLRRFMGSQWTVSTQIRTGGEWASLRIVREGKWLALWVNESPVLKWRARIRRGFILRYGAGGGVAIQRHPVVYQSEPPKEGQ